MDEPGHAVDLPQLARVLGAQPHPALAYGGCQPVRAAHRRLRDLRQLLGPRPLDRHGERGVGEETRPLERESTDPSGDLADRVRQLRHPVDRPLREDLLQELAVDELQRDERTTALVAVRLDPDDLGDRDVRCGRPHDRGLDLRVVTAEPDDDAPVGAGQQTGLVREATGQRLAGDEPGAEQGRDRLGFTVEHGRILARRTDDRGTRGPADPPALATRPAACHGKSPDSRRVTRVTPVISA